MSLHKLEAVILRSQEIRETSLILTAFSRELGKIQGVAKGVRGSRSAVPWVLEPLTLQMLNFYDRRRSGLGLIGSFDLVDPFDGIRRDFTKIAYASFCLDLTEALTELQQPHSDIYELLVEVLRRMDQGLEVRLLARFYEANLLRLIGILPDPNRWLLSAGARNTLLAMLAGDVSRLRALRLTQEVDAELEVRLSSVTRVALERELKSRNFLYALELERSRKVPVASPRGEPVEDRETTLA